MRAPIVSVLPAGTMAQRFGRDLLVVVLHLLSNPSCRHEVGASWTDVAVTLVVGTSGPAAEVAGLVARPLPLGEMARVEAQRSSGRRTRLKLTPSSEGLGFDSACAPGFRTQLHVTTSLSTGGGPVSYVQLSEGGFQVVYPLGL